LLISKNWRPVQRAEAANAARAQRVRAVTCDSALREAKRAERAPGD
jgi:hypothetical protein